MVWEKLIAWVSFAAVLAALVVSGGCESRKTPEAAEPLFAVEEDVEAVWEAGYPGLEMPYEPVPGDDFLTDEEVLP